MTEKTKETDYIALAEETLTGDIRDMILTHIRSMETPWSKLGESQQRDKVYAATEAAGNLVRKAVNIIAKRELPCIHVQLGKWTVDKGVKLETIASATTENIERLAEHGKGYAILVFADSEQYFGERASVQVDPDEPELPIASDDDDGEEGDEMPPAPAPDDIQDAA